MLKVGITGGIGSGKTTVCKVFEALKIPVFYADIEAKKAYQNPIIAQQVVAIFGKQAYKTDKTIDSKYLADIVFKQPKYLAQLNAIIHPFVNNLFEIWQQQHSTAPYVIKEAAILFETGSYKNLDKIITVVAPKDLKIKRIMSRDNINRKEIEDRMNKQWTDDEKIELSDFVIYNDQKQAIIPQVLKIHNILLALSP